MQFLLSRYSTTPVVFSAQSQLVTLIVALLILLVVPGRAMLVSSGQLNNPSSAWMDRGPRPMQPLQRVDLDRA